MRKNKWWTSLVICYLLSVICYTIYSYSQIDLNLTLSSNKIYQSFQNSMIQLGYFNRPLSTLIYSLIIFILYTLYFILYTFFKKRELSIKAIGWLVGLTVGILLFSYPALSHDIFNYIFNAKMVLVYHKNPHINVALEFPNDLWTRFMRNTHTPAPYFYGWTILSLIPSILGLGKLTLNLLTFKLLEIPFFIWQIYLLNKILKRLLPKERLNRLFLFTLNPLILIETFGNGHNDMVMTSLALLSLWFLIKEKISLKNLMLSVFFLLLSASIKYVTVILLPVYLIYVILNLFQDLNGFRFKSRMTRKTFLLGSHFKKSNFDLGSVCALFLFFVIFTRPQDQFHPWYLIWSLSFAIFSRNEWILKILLFLSFSLMLRYAPFLYYGEYNEQIMDYRAIITYSIPTLLLVVAIFSRSYPLRGNPHKDKINHLRDKIKI